MLFKMFASSCLCHYGANYLLCIVYVPKLGHLIVFLIFVIYCILIVLNDCKAHSHYYMRYISTDLNK